MMPFGFKVTLFLIPLPSPGVQRDPEPTAEGATEGLSFHPCAGRQSSGPAAAASLQSPRTAPLSRANPEQRGAPWGRSPLQKENNPHFPAPASSEPRRDGSLAWASPDERWCGAHRDPPAGAAAPLPSASAPEPRFGAFVFVCQGRARLGGTRRAVTQRHSPAYRLPSSWGAHHP